MITEKMALRALCEVWDNNVHNESFTTPHTLSPCHPEAVLWPKDPYRNDAMSVQQLGAAINFVEDPQSQTTNGPIEKEILRAKERPSA
jgi:hypothetical protein